VTVGTQGVPCKQRTGKGKPRSRSSTGLASNLHASDSVRSVGQLSMGSQQRGQQGQSLGMRDVHRDLVQAHLLQQGTTATTTTHASTLLASTTGRSRTLSHWQHASQSSNPT
jgi:hypothetical protein